MTSLMAGLATPGLTRPDLTPPDQAGALCPGCAQTTRWLYREAELLDGGREREWLETMVSRDISYQMPIRQTTARAAGRGFAGGGFHLNEDYASLQTRVRRNESPSAWTEDPPPRTRRFVTNIQVAQDANPSGQAGRIRVRSNLLVFRTRYDQTEPHLLAGERRDVLVAAAGGLRLLTREILLDHSVLGVPNLSYLL
jgi:ethylbenzene dioxygenase beta subunit